MKPEDDEIEEIREWLLGLVREDQAENGGSFADAFARFTGQEEGPREP